jgi:hypothetical protein
MSDTLQQFEWLATKFETLAFEMRTCTNPQRRIELLQQMKILIDEIDGVIFMSLTRQHKQSRRVNPNVVPEQTATS